MQKRFAARGASSAVLALTTTALVATGALAFWSTGGAGSALGTTGTLNPPANVDVSAVEGTSNSVAVTWTPANGAATITGYRVSKDTAAGVELCNGPASSTSCEVTNLAPSSDLSVVVTALAGGWTASSAVATGTTNAAAAALAITAPATTGASTSPTIAGTSSATGTIAIALYSGTTVSGSPVASGTAEADGTPITWEFPVLGPLANDADYFATATQTTAGGTSTATRQFRTIAAADPVVVTSPATLPDGVQDAAYGEQLTATGGTGPYIWTALDALPVGLSLSSGGLLSGTPSSACTTSFSVTATDNASTPDTGSKTLTLTVNAPADTTAPTVTNVTSSQANGTYTVGQVIPISVSFSESVTVAGTSTPQLTLETGNVDRLAAYSSGSGTGTLTFDYTVAAGDSTTDLDYVGTGSLGLPAGTTLKDAAGNNADLTLPTPGMPGSLGANKAIVIDAVGPTVTINRAAGQGDPTNSATINFTVVFSESVTGFATGDVALTGTAGATTGTVTGSGTTYNVAVNGMTSNGTVIATVPAGTAADAVGNTNTASPSSSVTYDTTAPAAPTLLDLEQTSDTGASNSDNITSAGAPVFTGSAETGSTVTLYSEAIVLGTGTATSGTFSIAATIAEGLHTVTAKATDGAGNTSGASDGLSVRVDRTGPQAADVQSTRPNANNKIDATDTIRLSFSEVIDSQTVLAAWTGSSLGVRVVVTGNNTSVLAQVQNAAGTAVANLGNIGLNGPYKANGTCTTCTLTANMTLETVGGKSVVVLTMTSSPAGMTVDNNVRTMTWGTLAGLLDLAGNAGVTAAATETGTADRDF